MSNNRTENKQEFSEVEQYQAYIELCNIIRRAIETQDYSSLEPNIAIWKHKYKLDNLSDITKIFTNREIARKIEAILNRDYLSRLIGDYLASKILSERQKQQEYYNNLKKIIETAKKTKDYKTAKKEVTKWKNSLHDNGFSIYDFNKAYNKQILKMLLLPSKELSKQKEASDSLKELVANSDKMGSEDLSYEINSWQNKYSIETFPDDLKKELNGITTDILKSVSIKKSEETALQEIKDYTFSEDKISPAQEIPEILAKYNFDEFSENYKTQINYLAIQAMSLEELTLDNENSLDIIADSKNGHIPPVQKTALYDLQAILNKNTHDMEGLFNWIYLNRKIDFVPSAVDEIKSLFSMAGFPKPKSGEYNIPSLKKDIKNLKPKEIEKIREQVVLNYLGILYMDNKSLSASSKNNISNIHTSAESLSVVEDIVTTPDTVIILPVEDNTVSSNISSISDSLGEEEFTSQEELDETSDEINIIIDTLLENPLETYELSTAKVETAPLINADTKDSKISVNTSSDKASSYLSAENIDTEQETISLNNESKKDLNSVTTSFEENKNDVFYTNTVFSGKDNTTINNNQEDNIYTPHLLTVEDQKALEETNYTIVGFMLGLEPSKELSESKYAFQDLQVEKNNGFN